MRSSMWILLTPEATLAARPLAKSSLAAPAVVLGVVQAVRDCDWADSPFSASCDYRCSLASSDMSEDLVQLCGNVQRWRELTRCRCPRSGRTCRPWFQTNCGA